MNKQAHYDCIIFGAGPAGLSAAIRLIMAGWKVAVVERQALPRDKVCGGFIGPENKAILESFGVWEKIAQRGAVLNTVMLSADEKIFIRIPVSRQKQGFGIGINRRNFDQILLERAKELGVDIFDNGMQSLKEDGQSYVLSLTHGVTKKVSTFSSRNLIYATGAVKKSSSPVVALGAGAIFENVDIGDDEVVLSFAQNGHIGINPFGNGLVNACYVADLKLFEENNKDLNRIFEYFLNNNAMLAKAFKGAKLVQSFKGVALTRGNQFLFSNEGGFCVGDAVGVINPVVGGGNSIALLSSLILAEEMIKFKPGELLFYQVAKSYERRWRKEFASRLNDSWLLGKLSHQHELAKMLIKTFQWQSGILENIFIKHHPAMKVKFSS